MRLRTGYLFYSYREDGFVEQIYIVDDIESSLEIEESTIYHLFTYTTSLAWISAIMHTLAFILAIAPAAVLAQTSPLWGQCM